MREFLDVFLVKVAPHEVFLVVDHYSDPLRPLYHDGRNLLGQKLEVRS
jgi:hypothetical protein